MTLPYAEARRLVDDARARGEELGKALSIAAVDYGGFLVLVERMDGARPMTPSIAISKAYSAAVMQRPTYMLEGWRNSDPVFFTQVGRMGQHPIVATKGGYTLKRDGVIVGGFGVSGGSPDEDQKICEDVLRAAGFDLDFPEWAGSRLARPMAKGAIVSGALSDCISRGDDPPYPPLSAPDGKRRHRIGRAKRLYLPGGRPPVPPLSAQARTKHDGGFLWLTITDIT